MIQDIEDADWVLSASLDKAFEALIALDLTFDALITPRHLGQILTRLKAHPELKAVIDHGAKPDIQRGDLAPWADGLQAIADETTAFCKLSGLVTEAGQGWTEDMITPVMAHLTSLFGEDRVMWGSDWPVALLASDYQRWFDLAHNHAQHLSPTAPAKIFGANAARFYDIPTTEESS